MKRLLLLGLLGLGCVCAARAQETATSGKGSSESTQVNFADTSAAKITLFEPASPVPFPAALPAAAYSPTGTSAGLASAAPAPVADPAPEPKFLYGGRDDYRWQLGIGADFIRFRSSIFNASAVGAKVSITYFTNDWFGIEGNVTADFAPQIFDKEHVKVLDYGAGPKIVWRQKRWEPWLHGIFGGSHEQPQTAGHSRNSYSIQAGGGVDYRWNPRVSFRLEANYVRTGFFSQAQNDIEVAGGIVFHF
jgi:Outer membrane protein beta-barrel domain